MSFSVYIHIPFCSRRCDYCDFATWTDKNDMVDRYISAVAKQWKLAVANDPSLGNEELTSIFFGGGTPNFIDSSYIKELLDTISADVGPLDKAEITLESNPDHVTRAKSDDYISAGVNRISLGVQSTQKHVLEFIGREHTPDHVPAAIDLIREAGITNINCDLIFGAPNESLSDWEKTLKDVLDLHTPHVSTYALGIEKGTPLGIDVAKGIKGSTDEDDLADKYELVDTILNPSGKQWYEISNWSEPGLESRHNLSYWHGKDVIALGCAAHGYRGTHRFSTPRHIDKYVSVMDSISEPDKLSHLYIDVDRTPTSISRNEELFALQMRTRSGVAWPQVRPTGTAAEFTQEGLVEIDSRGHVALHGRGRLLAHRITLDLYDQYAKIVEDVE